MQIRLATIQRSTAHTRRARDGARCLRTVVGAIVCLLLAAPSLAAADAVRCSRAIASAAAIFAQTTLTASQRCADTVVRGRFAGPCPGSKTTVKLAKIRAKLDDSIARECGGRDRVCGVGGDDDALATIGWNIGQCPNIAGGAQCSNAIANCTDLTNCLECVEGTIAGDAITLAFGAFTVGGPATPLGKCQREIGKRWATFLGRRTRALQRCEDGLLRGDIGGPCPDAKTALALAKIDSRLQQSLCRKCGGADKLCGGSDDLTPAAIGFAANCPNVTIPDGGACGGAITTLTNVVACLECVGRYDSECLTRLAAPAVVSYPAECSPPNGTCALPILVPAFGGLVDVNTTTAADNFSSTCGGSGAGEIVLQWTPDVSGTATVNTCLSNTFNTVLYVRQTDCAGGSTVTCDDDNCAPGSSISFDVVSGETYFIFVDGFASGDQGQATVTVIPPAQ